MAFLFQLWMFIDALRRREWLWAVCIVAFRGSESCNAETAIRDWLLPFMQNNQLKFLTKDELRNAAMRELKVSKNAFDFAWMAAIEDAGRHDWYEPLRRRLRTKS